MPSKLSRKLNIAIIHDWFVGGGAEKVVEQLHSLYPDAPIYTSYCSDEWRERLDNKVVTGYLQKWPFSSLRKYLPVLRILWFKHLNLSHYDLVISSSGNGEAKFIRSSQATTHICYCHSPTHFYWRHYDKYLRDPGFGAFSPLARLGLKLLAGPLRKADYKAAQKVDYFIANSTHIKSDIKKYYERDSYVIHPPVSLGRFNKAKTKKRHGLVTISRLVPHKHVDVIVRGANETGLPLKVIGSGPELANLKKIAGSNVKFLGFVSNEAVGKHLASAEAFVFASFEDFGIAPIEALAAGTPVIAYRAGGALDYVRPGENGEFFDYQSSESLAKLLENFDPGKYTTEDIKSSAQSFSTENFRKNFKNYINQL